MYRSTGAQTDRRGILANIEKDTCVLNPEGGRADCDLERVVLLLFRRWTHSVPTCLWFDRQLLSELQLFVLPESLVTSLRYDDRCTHGIVIKLHISC